MRAVQLLVLCQQDPHGVYMATARRVNEDIRRRFELSVLRAEPAPIEALLKQASGAVDDEQLRVATDLRSRQSYKEHESWSNRMAGASLRDLCMPTGTAATQHVVFEESYVPSGHSSNFADTIGDSRRFQDGDGHIFIFCHGFQGNQYDLRYFRNRIGISFPRARLLCCASDEDHTHAHIAAQGGTTRCCSAFVLLLVDHGLHPHPA